MKLRTQLTFGFSLAVLLGVGATGGLLIFYSFQRSLGRLKGEQLLLAENRAGAISEEVAQEVARLRHLSTLADLDLTDANLEPEKAMLRHAQHDPRFFSMSTSAVSPSGRVLWTEPQGASDEHGDVSGDAWFREARAARGSFVTEEHEAQGPAKARLVMPLWSKGGDFVGALTSTLDPSATTRWADKLRVDLGLSGSASLVDRSGHEVVQVGVPGGPLPEQELAVGKALGGQEVSAWAKDPAGRGWLLTAVPVPHAGWSLLIRQARDELDDDLDAELMTLALLLVVGLASALAFGVVYSRALASPVVTLAQVAREVERGRFEAAPTPTRTDELGDLERAFFSMTATLEAKVRERTDELRMAQAALVAQEGFAAMGKTAAAIAHELKNALNGLGVAVEALTQGKLPASAQEAVREQVRSEVERLRDITDNLNIFAGAPRLNRSPQGVQPLAERAVTMLRDRIETSGVDLKVELPDDLPAVPCDGPKLQGVLINLLKNAIEAVEPDLDEQPPEAGRNQVRLLGRRAGEALELEVADTGPGIAEGVAARMFEPFFTTKRTGTGLGLAIARKVLEAHGGSLSWQPNQPHGTRFIIRLPLREAEARSA